MKESYHLGVHGQNGRKHEWEEGRDLSRETGMSGNFVCRIKGAKYRFDLQYLTWDFS